VFSTFCSRMDALLKSRSVDLVILDIMLPGEDGLSICRRLRAASSIPIIMVTARDEDIDRIIGLEIGADDYVTKPFNSRDSLPVSGPASALGGIYFFVSAACTASRLCRMANRSDHTRTV